MKMVGPGEFESPTSSMSTTRSNQLSYGPNEGSRRIIRNALINASAFYAYFLSALPS